MLHDQSLTGFIKFIAIVNLELFPEFNSQFVFCRRLKTWRCPALSDANGKQESQNDSDQHFAWVTPPAIITQR
jgi:hypothetical protein